MTKKQTCYSRLAIGLALALLISLGLPIVGFAPVAQAAVLGFSAAANYGAGIHPAWVDVGDFNVDGKPDLAVVNEGGGTVSVLLNNGDGTFAAKVDYAVGATPAAVAVGDFNVDGKPDLVVANGSACSVSVLLNNGNGTFAAKTDYGTSSCTTHLVVVGDFNADGKPDLAYPNRRDGYTSDVTVRLNDGDGTFDDTVATYRAESYTEFDPTGLVAGDFNNDGYLDWAVSNLIYTFNPYIHVRLNDGDGTFDTTIITSSAGFESAYLAMGDFDSDGDLDLVSTGDSREYFNIHTNAGGGEFNTTYSHPASGGPRVTAVEDFDFDGTPDVVLVNRTGNSVSVQYNGGDVETWSAYTYAVGTTPVSAAAADFNGDGLLDIVTANYGSNNVSILLNQSVVNPSISKIFSPATVSPDQPSTVTFTIHNYNPTGTTLTGIAFTDTLPAGLLVAGTPAVNNTCGGTVSAVANSGVISLTNGTLAGQATCTIGANVSSAISNLYTNTTGPISSNESGAGNPSNSANLHVCSSSLIVTTNADSGVGSLRQAIAGACSGAVITFDNDYTITLSSTLTIDKNMTIDGEAHAITISGDVTGDGFSYYDVRVFHVHAGVSAALQNLTISDGNGQHGGGIYNQGTLTVTDSTLSNNWGGIRNEVGATLVVSDSHFSENWVSFWGGDSTYATGGAILNHGVMTITGSTFSENYTAGIAAIGAVSNAAGGTAAITASTFYSNTGLMSGGALGNFGTMTVDSSVFTNNSGGVYPLGGGAILNQVDAEGSLIISGSTFSNNTAGITFMGTLYPGIGGAILSQGALSVETSTFQGNTASYVSGGSDTYGGAVFAAVPETGTVSLTNNTFLENSALLGGAVAASGENVSLINNTFVLNTATITETMGGAVWLDGSGTLYNNIVAQSAAGGNCEIAAGSVFTATNNLADDVTCGAGFTNSPSINLGTLGDYGGATETIPLLSGSSALDAGDSDHCPVTDQRGVARPQGAGCDIGALEASEVLYAVPGGATSGGCEDWANACELHYALSIAISGQEIWVAAGTYTPDTTGLVNPREADFQLKNGVAIYGGFAGTETAREQRDWATNITLLSGDLNGDDSGFTNNSENTYHVVMGATGATLDGVTISGGNANASNPYDRGGGMLNNTTSPTLTHVIVSGNSASIGGGMYNDAASPALTDVTFSGNAAGYSGGGMQNYTNSRPTLNNVTFSSNSAVFGGGMFNNSSSPMLTDVTFDNNRATTQYGGGMHNESGSSPTLTNVTFYRNSAANFGGGMYNTGSSPTLTNVTFSNNWVSTSSQAWGGGMANLSGSNPVLTNVTFNGNSANAPVNGGGAMFNWSSSPQVRNSILWGNSAVNGPQVYNMPSSGGTIINSVIPGCPSGSSCTNIITADPLLGALGGYGGNTQTRPLLPGSSAIDATSSNCPTVDQRGVTRSTPACDIGAFESQGFILAISGGNNQSTGINTAFATPLGLTVTANAAIEPVAGGRVTFTPPGSGASAAISGSPASIGAGGAASVTATANSIVGGPYNVVASASGAAASVNFSLANVKADTTTSLTSIPNPSTYGQSVTFTATVNPSAATGTVAFQNNGVAMPGCAAQTVIAGQATCTTAALDAGVYPNITAAYSGDASYNGSTSSPYAQTVNQANATITLGGLSQVFDGMPQPVSTTTTPEGLTVVITYTGATYGPSTTAPTDTGTYQVDAAIDEANYQGSASDTLTIAKANTTTALAASEATPALGSSVHLTATVVSNVSGALPPYGTVTFTDGGTTLCSNVPLDASGQAVCTTSAALPPGVHTLHAQYIGNANLNASDDDLIQTVRAADLVIVKTVTPSGTAPGETITYTLTFTNLGDALASGVVITDIVPAQVLVTGVFSSGLAITDTHHIPAYVWQAADLAPGAGGVITITGILTTGLPGGMSLSNTAQIGSAMPEAVTANNASTANLSVLNAAPVLASIHDQNVDELTLLEIAASATDINGDGLTFSLDLGAPDGAAITTDGVFTWTPNEDQGPEIYTVTVRVTDGDLDDLQAFTITVNEVNLAPIAVEDAYSIAEDEVLIAAAPGLLGNDSDADIPAQTLSAVLSTPPSQGSLTLDPDGGFTYTPPLNFNGEITFTYSASDGLLTGTAIVTITIGAVNDAPVGVEDAYTTDEDTLLTVAAPGVLANDTDADGDELSSGIYQSPAHGLIILNPDGSFTYDPAEDYYGTDAFLYEVSDGVLTDTVLMTITINAVNDAPVADANGPYSGDEGSPIALDGSGSSDVDGTIALYEWDCTADGSYDTASPNPDDSTCTYLDDGTYTVQLRITDNGSLTDTATSTVTVSDLAPAAGFDWAPEPQDEGAVMVFTDTSTSTPDALAAWDWDFGDLVTSTVQNPTHTYNDDGIYTVCLTATDDDGSNDTVCHDVTVVNVAPVADDQNITTAEDTAYSGTLTASDVAADPLEFGLNTAPMHGLLSIDLDGFYTYTPTLDYNGTDVFTFTVSDGELSDLGRVQITITPVNDVPVVDAGEDVDTFEGNLVQFNGGYTDPGRVPQDFTFTWDFGDGMTTTGTIAPSHTYEDDGVFTVVLTVDDGEGGIASDDLLVTVENIAPALASFADQAVHVGQAITLTAAYTDPGVLDTHTALIDWGNGITQTVGLAAGLSTFDFSGAYDSTGIYTVTVTLTDDDGGMGATSFTVTVSSNLHRFWIPFVLMNGREPPIPPGK